MNNERGIKLASGYTAKLPESVDLAAVEGWAEFPGGLVVGYDPVSQTGLLYQASVDRWQLMQPVPRAEFDQAIEAVTKTPPSRH